MGASAAPGFEGVVGGRGEVGLVIVDGVVEGFTGGGAEISDCGAGEHIVLAAVIYNIWFMSQINIPPTLIHKPLVSLPLSLEQSPSPIPTQMRSIKQLKSLLMRPRSPVHKRTT